MTARPFHAALVVVAMLQLFADSASAMLHPQQGRFMQRDPAGYVDGMGLYEYVRTQPVNWRDPSGKWKAGDHRKLTSAAFGLATIPVELGVGGCDKRLLSRLRTANVGQDSGSAMSENKRHYCRSIDLSNSNVDQANTEYRDYINSELRQLDRLTDFGTGLLMSECESAAVAIGRLTHTWQDYFAHAVLLNGQAGPAWSANPPTVGDPDNLNPNLKPPSWGSVADTGEHGITEPAYRDGDGSARMRAAETFVAARLTDLLDRWAKRCSCYCGTNKGRWP